MRHHLLGLAGRLRADGLSVSVGETLDALAAVAAVGVDREVLREALAATLVKNEDDRAVFDRRFDEAFPLRRAPVPAARGAGKRRGPRAEGAGAEGGSSSGGWSGGDVSGGRPASTQGAQRPRDGGTGDTRDDEDLPGAGTGDVRGDDAREARRGRERPGEGADDGNEPDARTATRRAGIGRDTASSGPSADLATSRRARARALRQKPFADYSPDDVHEARALLGALSTQIEGRFGRRERERRRGRVDLRRTLREAARAGGVPLRLRRRGRRPARPDLVALCDLSGSVAAVSELLLGLVVPAAHHFRRVALFGYVDGLCPVSLEQGHLAPGGPLDLHARSDFGRVLAELWPAHERLLGAGTLLLVLGDARNNRLPPRVDLLRAVRERVQRLVWLNPEPRARWSTGDSVQHLYAPSCDAMLECSDLDALVAAVRRLA